MISSILKVVSETGVPSVWLAEDSSVVTGDVDILLSEELLHRPLVGDVETTQPKDQNWN